MDWTTISSLATAGGTLVLAVATFASVRSANRAARTAEQTLLAGIRPLLVSSRLQDSEQKVGFADRHWVHLPGGRGTAEATDDAVYLTMSVRNVGDGLAVLHGWIAYPDRWATDQPGRPSVEDFRRLTRDLYVAPGDVGFWQGAIREPGSDDYVEARRAIETGKPILVDLLYGDFEGGQRVISRFSLSPAQDGRWLVSSSRHWNVDRPDPR